MPYPIIVFTCDCRYSRSDLPSCYRWNPERKRSSYHLLCPVHNTRMKRKIYLCGGCGQEYEASPRTGVAKYCPACRPDVAAIKKKPKVEPPVHTTTDPKIPPCARCDFGDSDKLFNPVCWECEYRIAWADLWEEVCV